MNELQLGLIGVGAVIVIAVIIYNAMQSKRVRSRLPRTMPKPEEMGVAFPAEGQEEQPFIQPSTHGRREPERPAAAAPVAPAPVAPAPPVAASPSTAAATASTVSKTGSSVPPVAPSASPPSSTASRVEPVLRLEPPFGGLGSSASASAEALGSNASGPDAANRHLQGNPFAETAASGHSQDVNSVAAASGVAPIGDTGNAENAAAAAVSASVDAAPGAAAHGAALGDAELDAQHAGAVNGTPDSAVVSEAPSREEAHVLSVSEAEAASIGATTVSNLPPVVVDRRIDCVVELELAERVTGDRVMPLAVRFRRAGSKPVYVEGRDEDGHWGTLRAGIRYTELRAAVQLANRAGALNELEFSEFVGGVHRIADALDAAVGFPDMSDVVQMARELDGFAAQCDAQLSVNILSDGAPWSGSYVQAVASQDGLLLSRDGTRFVKLDARQNPVFTLTFEGTNFLRDDLTYKGGHMITLLLDVPVADEDIMPWRLMCDYARSLGARIGARVVDDSRRVLPDASLQAIDDRLMTLYARLEQAGLPAGSAAARRLFSS